MMFYYPSIQTADDNEWFFMHPPIHNGYPSPPFGQNRIKKYGLGSVFRGWGSHFLIKKGGNKSFFVSKIDWGSIFRVWGSLRMFEEVWGLKIFLYGMMMHIKRIDTWRKLPTQLSSFLHWSSAWNSPKWYFGYHQDWQPLWGGYYTQHKYKQVSNRRH